MFDDWPARIVALGVFVFLISVSYALFSATQQSLEIHELSLLKEAQLLNQNCPKDGPK